LPSIASSLFGQAGPFAAWGKHSRPRIFISYRRRGESSGFAARLTDRLVGHFGDEQCFRDVEDIESGVDFVDAIATAVTSCDALVVVIGTDWLEMRDHTGRRLDNPRDYVRLEIAAALQRNIRVIPVLVNGAKMPGEEELPPDIAGLSRRNALELSDSRWDYDTGQIVRALESIGIRPLAKNKKPAAASCAKKAAITVLAGLGGVGLLAVIVNLATLFAPQTYPFVPPDPGGAPGQEVYNPGLATPTQNGAVDPKQVSQRTPSYDDQLREALQRSVQARVSAGRTVDVRALEAAYTDIALQYMANLVAVLAKSGAYAEHTLHSQNISFVQVSPDGLHAAMDVQETWSSTYYNQYTGQCTAVYPTYQVPQRLLFTNQSGRWLIHSIEYQAFVDPPGTTCL
jgi:hypothetical protein